MEKLLSDLLHIRPEPIKSIRKLLFKNSSTKVLKKLKAIDLAIKKMNQQNLEGEKRNNKTQTENNRNIKKLGEKMKRSRETGELTWCLRFSFTNRSRNTDLAYEK